MYLEIIRMYLEIIYSNVFRNYIFESNIFVV